MAASSGGAAATGANAILFQSRDELRKQRDLEEARKSGLIPAEKDEEGKDINPHIPQYIAKAPWYLSQDCPSLKHQRFKEEEKVSIDKWYIRGVTKSRPKRFRPGACANCGAMTHSAKDCTERPRKTGAKWTTSDMQPDEIIGSAHVELDWDSKRDRWGGYDPNTTSAVIKEYEMAEVERKRRKQDELHQQLRDAKSRKRKVKLRARISRLKAVAEDAEDGGEKDGIVDERGDSDSDSDSGRDSDSDSGSDVEEDSDDEDARIRDFDETNAVVGSKDDRTRTTTRNLRIREDTAKYLHNLDEGSAFYDPKTRSMRDNPMQTLKDEEQGIFRGDNIMRHTGDAVGVAKMELFSWEAYKQGANVHFQSMPTQLEFFYKQHLTKNEKIKDAKRDNLLSKYCKGVNPEAPKELLFSQTEAYVEYLPDGTRKKGSDRALAVSKYVEDVHIGNHSAIWGSWYDLATQRWGFRCCHQCVKTTDCSAVASVSAAPPVVNQSATAVN